MKTFISIDERDGRMYSLGAHEDIECIRVEARTESGVVMVTITHSGHVHLCKGEQEVTL